MRPLPSLGAISSKGFRPLSQCFRRTDSTLMSLLGTPERKSAFPKPSASLVIVNEKNEVLLIHRNPKVKSFGGVHVFPGGNYDAQQDDSFSSTAIRETFEETGLLITEPSPSNLPDKVVNEARQAILSNGMTFRTFLDQHHIKIDEKSLFPFTQWISPVTAPKRFHTHFFIFFLSSASSEGKQERIPTPDGGHEVLSTRFLRPADALAEFATGKITIFPPQFYLLSTLSDILHGPFINPAERDRILSLSRGTFGRYIFKPQILPEKNDQGDVIITYEGDELRGGLKGRLHRVLIKNAKPGASTHLQLQRNFDIFTEIDVKTFPGLELAKL